VRQPGSKKDCRATGEDALYVERNTYAIHILLKLPETRKWWEQLFNKNVVLMKR
jgi:hypothetical protein